MRNFLYRCPVTAMNVQGTARDDEKGGQYSAQFCPACGRVHLINPLTGEGFKGSEGGKGRIVPNYKLESRR